MSKEKIDKMKALLRERLSHADLVQIGRVWLAARCNPVFTELGSDEKPDVIGWSSSGSYVIECKTNVADFNADLKKKFRRDDGSGMGCYRYYLMTRELYDQVCGKWPQGWGVLLVDWMYGGCRQRNRCGSKLWTNNVEAELAFLRNRLLSIQNYGR